MYSRLADLACTATRPGPQYACDGSGIVGEYAWPQAARDASLIREVPGLGRDEGRKQGWAASCRCERDAELADDKREGQRHRIAAELTEAGALDGLGYTVAARCATLSRCTGHLAVALDGQLHHHGA